MTSSQVQGSDAKQKTALSSEIYENEKKNLWISDEDEILKEAINEGTSWDVIAGMLNNRTKGACKKRAAK